MQPVDGYVGHGPDVPEVRARAGVWYRVQLFNYQLTQVSLLKLKAYLKYFENILSLNCFDSPVSENFLI